jgi:hypothetical protein
MPVQVHSYETFCLVLETMETMKAYMLRYKLYLQLDKKITRGAVNESIKEGNDKLKRQIIN